jgi:predicted membrane protein
MENEQQNNQQNGQQGQKKEGPQGVFIGLKVGRADKKAAILWPRGLFFPILVLFIGVVYLLDQMGIVSAHYVFHYFSPAVFIYFGLGGILFKTGPGRFWGWFLTLAGGFLLLINFGIIHASWGIMWPLLIIFCGVWLLAQAMGLETGCRRVDWNKKAKEWGERVRTNSTDARSDISVVFSSVKRQVASKDFEGGKMSAMFGEGDVDLTQADIAGEEAVIQVDAVFGAHKIRVPQAWKVLMHGTAVFGEFLDKTSQRSPEGAPVKRLVVKGSAVFGSVVITN